MSNFAQYVVYVPTTCDVDGSVLIPRSLDGVRFIDEILPISNNKNDYKSLVYLPFSLL